MIEWIARAAIAVACACCGCGAKHEAPKVADIPKPAAAANLSEPEKKLDGSLVELVRAQDPAATVKAMHLEERDSKIKVEIVAVNKGAVPALKTQLQSLGAVDIVDLENHIWAYIAVAAVGPLSRSEQVWSMAVSRPLVTPKEK